MNVTRLLNARVAVGGLLLLGWLTGGLPDAVAAPTPTRIALLSDSHVTRRTDGTKPFHAGRLRRTIAAVNAAKVDLVLFSGDLTEDGTREELADFRRLIRHLDAPVWCVPGNHDVGGKRIPGQTNKNDITEARLQAFAHHLGQSWFIREQAGVRIVGVNGSLLGSGFAAEQAMWRSLTAALAKPAPSPTLLLIHYPLYSDKPDERGGVYWNVEPGPRKRLLQLIQSGNVRAVLSGHLHREILRRADGRLWVTTPPIAFGIPQNRQYRGWTLLTVPQQGEIQAEFRYQVD